MKYALLFLLLFSLLSISCTHDDDSEDQLNIPECLSLKIDEIKSEAVWSPPAKIFSYQYNGQLVYYLTAHCCDIPSEVYDHACNYICGPDGGIAGPVDTICLDFHSTKSDEILLWEDDR